MIPGPGSRGAVDLVQSHFDISHCEWIVRLILALSKDQSAIPLTAVWRGLNLPALLKTQSAGQSIKLRVA